MVDITLLELHLEDASFSANAPFTGSGGESDAGGGSRPTDAAGDRGESNGPRRRLLALVGLVMVLALAWLASRRNVGEEIEIAA